MRFDAMDALASGGRDDLLRIGQGGGDCYIMR